MNSVTTLQRAASALKALRLLPLAGFLILMNTAPAEAQTRTTVSQLAGAIDLPIDRSFSRLIDAASTVSVLEERVDFTWDGTDWEPSSQATYTYDGTQRIEQRTYFWNETTWENDARTTYTRNGSALTVELHEQWDPVANDYVPSEQYEYSYVYEWSTGKAAVESVIHKMAIEGEWLNVERTVYTLGNFGGELLATAGQFEEWDSQTESWTPRERFTLTEETNGVVQTTQEWDGMDWVNVERSRFSPLTIPALHSALNVFLQELEDQGFLMSTMATMPPYVTQEWDGTTWVTTSRLHIETYNMYYGTPGTMLIQYYDEGVWTTETRYLFEYDFTCCSLSRPLAATMSTPDEGEWIDFMHETYEYDARGDLLAAVQQMDLGGGFENVASFEYTRKQIQVGTDKEAVPGAYKLDPAYPNPFNPATTVSYHLASAGHVSVRVYDSLGRLVSILADGVQVAGQHDVSFQAANLPSGLYLVRMEAPGFQQSRTVTLLK